MNSATFLIGRKRWFFNQYMKMAVLLHFTGEVAAGRMPAKGFTGFLKRLLYFLAKMKDNKYVTSGGATKVNLYVPAFPSRAFYKACGKVLSVGTKLPCVTVLLSVTSACRFRCGHCYQKLDLGKDLPIEYLVDVVRTLDAMGVAFFNIEGGDPFLVYDRLKAVCTAVTTGEIWVNSTGDGITRERLTELRGLGVKGIMFSLHAADEPALNRFMGRENAWSTLAAGVAACHAAGVDVAFNACLLRDAFYDGTFQKVMDHARNFGATIVQLIKPKPSGGWLGADMKRFSPEDMEHIDNLVHAYNNEAPFRSYPFVAAQQVDERSDMFGCTAGGTDRFYINAKGDVQPCEFLNISFGNIREEPFTEIYERMRRVFDLPGDRWLCEACADGIHRLHRESGARSLPLIPSLSAQIHEHWERGAIPDFYARVDARYRNAE
jgi:MoaA/NifB/PqqE/SkfB family radical SAM enzyme